MGAQGSQSGIAILQESEWGVNLGTQMEGINFVDEGMTFGITNQISNNIRPDRQTSDLIQVSAECAGGFNTEFQATNLDSLLPSFLWDDNGGNWRTAPVGESVAFTVETGAGVGGVMTVANSSLYSIGQVIWITGSTLNDGRYIVKAIPDGVSVQVHLPLVTEGAVAVTFGGEWIRNGVFKTSYSIERANYDISQFFLYTGMTPNTMEWTIESGSPIMVALEFVGKEEQLAQAPWNTPAPTELSTEPIMNAVSSVAQITIDGAILEACLLQSVTFLVDNQVEGKTGIGVLGFCAADAKSLLISGSISMYFNDETYYQKYLDSTSFGLSFTFVDTVGNSYDVQLPECKFDATTANVTGKDDDVMVEGTFVAIMDPVSGYTIQMSRDLVA